PLGSRARRHRQPSARPADASGQGEISGGHTGTLGQPAIIPSLDSICRTALSARACDRSPRRGSAPPTFGRSECAFADALDLNLRDLLCLLLRKFSRQYVDSLDGGWLGEQF